MLRVVTPPAVPPRGLVTAILREDLRVTSSFDREIERAVEDVTAMAENTSSVRWVYREYIENVVVRVSTPSLYLQARPIQSVTSVTFDGDELLEVDGDFAAWPRSLVRESGWQTGRPGWEVRYFGGYWVPSMGAVPVGTESIDSEGIHLRKALKDVMIASWRKSCVDDKKPSDFQVSVPSSSLAVFRQEGPPC